MLAVIRITMPQYNVGSYLLLTCLRHRRVRHPNSTSSTKRSPGDCGGSYHHLATPGGVLRCRTPVPCHSDRDSHGESERLPGKGQGLRDKHRLETDREKNNRGPALPPPKEWSSNLMMVEHTPAESRTATRAVSTTNFASLLLVEEEPR